MSSKSTFSAVFDTSRLGVWPARATWLICPIIYQLGFGRVTDSLTSPGSTLLEGFLWAVWFVGLISVWVNHPITLTVIRVLAPSVPLSILAGALLSDAFSPAVFVTAGFGVMLVLVIFLPAFGDPMINGSAYGAERRLALRPPAFVLFGPIQLLWLAIFASVGTGLVFIATGRHSIGTVVLGVGAIVTFGAGKTLHKLARRWLVFVPAGFVLHDHVVLSEPVLVPRKVITSLGLVAKETPDVLLQQTASGETVDTTGGASGLVLQVQTSADISVGLQGRNSTENRNTRSIRFNPTLPGVALSEARARGIQIGTAES